MYQDVANKEYLNLLIDLNFKKKKYLIGFKAYLNLYNQGRKLKLI